MSLSTTSWCVARWWWTRRARAYTPRVRLQQVKRLNEAVFPVTYNERFYEEVVERECAECARMVIVAVERASRHRLQAPISPSSPTLTTASLARFAAA